MQSLEGSQESCILFPSPQGCVDMSGQVLPPIAAAFEFQAGDNPGPLLIPRSCLGLFYHLSTPTTKKEKKKKKQENSKQPASLICE